jgi:hypothetical protein
MRYHSNFALFAIDVQGNELAHIVVPFPMFPIILLLVFPILHQKPTNPL